MKIKKLKFFAIQLKSFGKNADRLGDVYTAIDYYEPYCKLRPNDTESNFRLAHLFFMSRDYGKAEKQFGKVAKEYPEALYYQAQAQKSQGKYELAKETFAKFQKKLK